MHQHTPESDYVRLFHCPAHEAFHLWVGKATVHLTPRELLLLGAAIDRWWRQHPEELEKLEPFDLDPDLQSYHSERNHP